jgi:hypothetical protein
MEKGENQFLDLKAVFDYILSPEFDNEKTVFLTDPKRGFPSQRAIPASF